MTFSSAEENAFVLAAGPSPTSDWAIGLYQADDCSEPAGEWQWVTGEPLTYTNWFAGEPNDAGFGEDYAELRKSANPQWNDRPNWGAIGAIIEWDDVGTESDCDENGVPDSCDPDCNGNGIPDACDIAAGETDKDQDGVPDSCEYARGDFDLNGCVEGLDLSFILATWGMYDVPVGDLDGSGQIGGGDLTHVFANWGCY